MQPSWKKGASVVVVLASAGYPGDVKPGQPITGLSEVAAERDVKVFHAATRLSEGVYYTCGGRVLGVTAFGDSVSQAAFKTYDAISKIGFNGMQFRRDIGRFEASREVSVGGGKIG